MAFILQKASNLVTHNLEKGFFWWGHFVSRHPYPVICTCLVITAISSVGFLNFRMEHEANLLWINSDSSYNFHEAWLRENFRKNERGQVITVKSNNVLEPSVINKMLDLYKKVQSISSHGKTFSDICATVPIADIFQSKKRRKRQAIPEDDTYDYSSIWGEDYYSDDVNDGKSENIPTIEERINFAKYGRKVINATENEASDDTKEHIDDLPANIYCDLINTLNEKCIQTSLLEMWRYEEDLIRSTTREEILAAVINGGTTTFLALLFCGLSSSHVYQTFFKVFSLTVVFGLFHGLVLLPVVLSILGPSHTSSDQSSDAESINTGTVSAGSSRSESPERPIKSKDNMMEPQWTMSV